MRLKGLILISEAEAVLKGSDAVGETTEPEAVVLVN